MIGLLLLLAPQDSIDRLIEHLKGGAELHRELATLGLRAYGSAAGERLKKAGLAADLLEAAARTLSPDEAAVDRKLRTLKVDLEFEDTALQDILSFIRDFSGLNIVWDPSIETRGLLKKPLTLDLKEKFLGDVLAQVLAKLDLTYGRVETVLHIGPPPPRPDRIPLRLAVSREVGDLLVARLGSDALEERESAAAQLEKLGFGVESLLWTGVRKGDAEVRSRSAELLRKLYRPPAGAHGEFDCRVTIDMQDAPLCNIIEYLAEIAGVHFVLDPVSIPKPEDVVVTLKLADTPLRLVLDFLLLPRGLTSVEAAGCIIVAAPGRVVPPSDAVLRADPADAPKIEAALEGLASPEADRHGPARDALLRLGPRALGALAAAAKAMGEPAAGRCRAVRQEIVRGSTAWIVDEPGLESRLTEAQRKALGYGVGQTYSSNVKFGDFCLLLEELLKIKVRVLSGEETPMPYYRIPKARVDTLLTLFTRLNGIDGRLEGSTLIFDTAARTRDALEK